MTEATVIDAPDLELCTQAFIDKFTGSDLARSLVEQAGLSEQDALAWAVMVQANGHMPIHRSRGQEAQGLSRWHIQLRGECSTNYRRLRAENPDISRGEVNAIPELSSLNAVRRGVGMAMRKSYVYVGRASKQL